MTSERKKPVKTDMDERVELSMLYDFYGALLKENQQEMFEAYIQDDYSLSEIAEEMGITRQGVHDAVKRVEARLRKYEENLGLVERFRKQQSKVKKLQDKLQELQITEDSPQWQEIFSLLEEIIEE